MQRWSHTWPHFLVERGGAGPLPKWSSNYTRVLCILQQLSALGGHDDLQCARSPARGHQDAWPTSPKMAPTPLGKSPKTLFLGNAHQIPRNQKPIPRNQNPFRRMGFQPISFRTGIPRNGQPFRGMERRFRGIQPYSAERAKKRDCNAGVNPTFTTVGHAELSKVPSGGSPKGTRFCARGKNTKPSHLFDANDFPNKSEH